ncbi:MAG: cofactor-independent phosphoglycerate mutase [Actinobacteria bacterium]|nr:cofactor-independent phosphoglycerate mutase [Actinomycetota bacterium]
MKHAVLIPDGSADHPLDELGGRTPLAAARTANLDRLAAGGRTGLVRTIPAGFPAGSDVANLCVLGYDPHVYYTGRAPLEAASLGIELGPDDVAFRCNLVCVEDGVMRDFAAGHIGTEEAARLIGSLQSGLGGAAATFYAGLSYRHIMISPGRAANAKCTPPHDISGRPVAGFLPRGEGSDWLKQLMSASAKLLENHPVNQSRRERGETPANMIWLWGQGRAPRMPSFQQMFGMEGSVISAVDLVKGLGKYAGLDVIEVPGATGYLDTDYAAKAMTAAAELSRKDFVYVHVEAPDEASHMGSVREKLNAIERFDRDLVGTLLKEAPSGLKIMVLPDHATPVEIKTHTDEEVPFVVYEPASSSGSGLEFNEASASRSALRIENGWELMGQFLGTSDF